MTGMTTILLLANLLVTAGVFLCMRHARAIDRRVEAQHRLDVIARIGGLTVAVEAQTDAFNRGGAALLAAVRAVVPAVATPIPAAPVSGKREVEHEAEERHTVDVASAIIARRPGAAEPALDLEAIALCSDDDLAAALAEANADQPRFRSSTGAALLRLDAEVRRLRAELARRTP